MSESRKIVFVTGANSGIGFELASQLMAKGTYHVLVCSRTLSKGEAAIKALQARNHPGTCELVQLDQTSDDSIAAAAEQVHQTHGHLDVLVNNAAIALNGPVTRREMHETLDTNVAGPALVTEAFLPLLQASKHGARIVNVSSSMGSIGMKLDHSSPLTPIGTPMYRMSKAALNMLSAIQVWEYRDMGIKVFTYCPGFTESNLGSVNKVANGARPTSESTAPLVALVEGKRDGEAGKFLSCDLGEGGEFQW